MEIEMYSNSCQKPYNMVSKTEVKYLSKTVSIEESSSQRNYIIPVIRNDKYHLNTFV